MEITTLDQRFNARDRLIRMVGEAIFEDESTILRGVEAVERRVRELGELLQSHEEGSIAYQHVEEEIRLNVWENLNLLRSAAESVKASRKDYNPLRVSMALANSLTTIDYLNTIYGNKN